MQSLEVFLDILTHGRRIHISILDVTGILSTPKTEISLKYAIHSKSFCSIAKSTRKGYTACLECKAKANKKAIMGKCPFSGHCACGLFEAAVPLRTGDSVSAVVYVGNAICDEGKTKSRVSAASRETGVDEKKLLAELDKCERVKDESELVAIGEIVCDYVRALRDSEPAVCGASHWLTAAMKRHADEEFCHTPTIKELSLLYRKSEKYMGRLFESEMGMSFHAYCQELRLRRAANLLLRSSEKIIDVALDSGFNSIAYFNRTFREKYGMTPGEYKKLKKKSDS